MFKDTKGPVTLACVMDRTCYLPLCLSREPKGRQTQCSPSVPSLFSSFSLHTRMGANSVSTNNKSMFLFVIIGPVEAPELLQINVLRRGIHFRISSTIMNS